MILLIKMFPAIIGIILILISFLPERHKKIKYQCYTQAQVINTVTQNVYQKHSERLIHSVVVRYQTEQGKEIEATSRNFVPEWQIGERIGDVISICYDRENPQLFEIHDSSQHRFRKTICLTVGIVILVAYVALCMQYDIL